MVEVLGHWMCGSYDANGNPLDIKNEFTTNEDIYQITKFGFNYGGLVEWHWYRNGSLYYDGNPQTIPNPSDHGYEWWNWYQLGVGWTRLPTGNWFVEVYLNGELALIDYFIVGSKDIKEIINWQAFVPSGSLSFYLFSLYGTNTNNTIGGFQIETSEAIMVTTSSVTREDTILTSNVLEFDCLTIIAENFDGSTISGIYDWKIDNNVI